MSRRPLVRLRAGVEIGGMRPDIVPGAVFPDYELSDHRGKHRTLSELQQGDPLVLVLSRGGFCPKERRQHEGLLQLHREMQVGYCRLVTISTDNLLETNEFRTCRFSIGPRSNGGMPARRLQTGCGARTATRSFSRLPKGRGRLSWSGLT